MKIELGDGSLYQELIIISPGVRLSKLQEWHRAKARILSSSEYRRVYRGTSN